MACTRLPPLPMHQLFKPKRLKVTNPLCECRSGSEVGGAPRGSRKPPRSSSTRKKNDPAVAATFSLRHRLATKRNMPRPMVCRQNRMSMKVKNLCATGWAHLTA